MIPTVLQLPEEARDLARELEDLGVGWTHEYSFKLLPGRLLTRRMLMALRSEGRHETLRAPLLALCRRMGMPGPFLEAFERGFPETNIVLLGYEYRGDRRRNKAYLEYGGRFETHFGDPDGPRPFRLHDGFKWDAADPRRHTRAHYRCLPISTVSEMMERILASHGAAGEPADSTASLTPVIGRILDLAAGRTGPDRFLFLEAVEDGNPRKSYDVNMYRANLRFERLGPLIRELFEVFGLDPAEVGTLLKGHRDRIFGHLTGGVDRTGENFVTLYWADRGSGG